MSWWFFCETADIQSTEILMYLEILQLQRKKKNLFHVATSTQIVCVL